MFALHNGAYGNNGLVGQQIIWFDNITYSGRGTLTSSPRMSIQTTTPALRMFGGVGGYGRSQLSLSTN